MNDHPRDRPSAQYEVVWSESALKTLQKLDKPTQERIAKAAWLLSNNPHPPAAKRLTGTGAGSTHSTFRIRVGDWRVLYLVRDRELIVLIVKVGHRSKVYRNL